MSLMRAETGIPAEGVPFAMLPTLELTGGDAADFPTAPTAGPAAGTPRQIVMWA